MPAKSPSFTVGIEEEYLLVDRVTRGLVSEPPPDMIAKCEARLKGQVASEFLQTQIEVGTRVCTTLQEARDDLANLRGTVAEVADEFGLAPIAAATHPFGNWPIRSRPTKNAMPSSSRTCRLPPGDYWCAACMFMWASTTMN